MASVVFAADPENEGQLQLLHMVINQTMSEGWTGLEVEVEKLRANGVRIGEMLITPPGYSKREISFAFQCWDVAIADLRKVARTHFDKPACKYLRAIGLN